MRRVLSCRTGGLRVCSRTHITPLWPPRRSLENNRLYDQAKQAIKDAAGSNVEIQL